ncbi:MAG TPA: hypothetical protein VJ751_03400 [Pyrinomonadaceae bacterium]|nr:hypothetical protein [Pyrinomonadaceae bacterium]
MLLFRPLGSSNLTLQGAAQLSISNLTYQTFVGFLDWFPNTRFGRKFLEIVYDTAILVSYLGAFALIHKLQEKWLGGDYLVFGKYKIEYIIHVGHLMALALFFLEIFKTGIEVVRDIMRVILGVVSEIRLVVQRNTK